MTACSSCHRPVRWVLTEAGKRMPIDPEPSDSGNVVFTGRVVTDEVTRAKIDVVRVLKKAEIELFPSGEDVDVEVDASARRYLSHFATCANSDRHRRRR